MSERSGHPFHVLSLEAVKSRATQLWVRCPAWMLTAPLILVTIASIAIRPQAIERYVSGVQKFYDAEHYVNIALHGYTDPSITAFFPLWPALLQVVSYIFGITEASQLAFVGSFFAGIIFIFSIFMMDSLARERFAPDVARFILFIYVFNPFSVFRLLPFSESLCSFILLALIKSLDSPKVSWPALLSLSILTGLSRPLWAILPIAVFGAVGLSRFFNATTEQRPQWSTAVLVTAGTFGGLAIFCLEVARDLGNPWLHFHSQEIWGRKLGIYWQLLYAPKSVGGSAHVLIWDLLAFWGPILVFVTALIISWRERQQGKPPRLGGDMVFWLCTLTSLGHALIAFFTYPIFASLGRHVFGIPLFLISIGTLFDRLPFKPRRRTAIVIALFCLASYVRWWARFAKGSWIG